MCDAISIVEVSDPASLGEPAFEAWSPIPACSAGGAFDRFGLDEQAALLRIATAVAHGVQPTEVFTKVVREVAGLSGASGVEAFKLARSGEAERLASCSGPGNPSGRAQVDAIRFDVRFGVAGTHAQGVIVVHQSSGSVLRAGFEAVIDSFVELASLAMANADARHALSSSRARLVRAGDEERRLIEQALREGPRRLLESVARELGIARVQLRSNPEQARRLIAAARETLDGGMTELQTLARGIHPVLLSERGLDTALPDLVSHFTVPVTLVSEAAQRFEPEVELGAYYFVAGALGALTSRAEVTEAVVGIGIEQGALVITVSDDGAEPLSVDSQHTLLLLEDRVAALGGDCEFAFSSSGTTIRGRIPSEENADSAGMPRPAAVASDGSVDATSGELPDRCHATARHDGRSFASHGSRRGPCVPAQRATADRRHGSDRELESRTAVLLRVATLVARNHAPHEVFAAIAEEVGLALGAQSSNIIRFDADEMLTVMAGWNAPGHLRFPDGGRLAVSASRGTAMLLESRDAVGIDQVDVAQTLFPEVARRMEAGAAGYLPLFVGGQLWGEVLATAVVPPVLRPGLEGFINKLLELATISIDNAQTTADLSASRSRLVRASDEARRGIERDLHDGAQQRFVSLAVKLQLVEILLDGDPAEAAALLQEAMESLDTGLVELSQLTRGIHPRAIRDVALIEALRELVANSGVPTTLTSSVEAPFDDSVQVAAYFVVSEALTNVAKHAHARFTDVTVSIAAGWLTVVISDDGRGGASAEAGTGVRGLSDRVQALGGRLALDSRVGYGTRLTVTMPCVECQDRDLEPVR